MNLPWKTLCGTAIVIVAMMKGYDSQLAAIAVCALFGVELYDLGKRAKSSDSR